MKNKVCVFLIIITALCNASCFAANHEEEATFLTDIFIGMEITEAVSAFQEHYGFDLSEQITEDALKKEWLELKTGISEDQGVFSFLGYPAIVEFEFSNGKLDCVRTYLLAANEPSENPFETFSKMGRDVLHQFKTLFGAQTDGIIRSMRDDSMKFYDFPLQNGIPDEEEMFRLLKEEERIVIEAVFGGPFVTLEKMDHSSFHISASYYADSITASASERAGGKPFEGRDGDYRTSVASGEPRSSIMRFLDIPFGLSPEECIAYMQKEHGITLVSTLTEEDRQMMRESLSLTLNSRITAPFGTMTFFGLPIYVSFAFSQNSLNGIFVKFTDYDYIYSEKMTAEERQETRQGMADIFFALSDYLQKNGEVPLDGELLIYGSMRFKDEYSFHYPMIDGEPNQEEIRKIIDMEENLSLSEIYNNVFVYFRANYHEGEEDGKKWISNSYDTGIYFRNTENEKPIRPFWGKGGDYFSPFAD